MARKDWEIIPAWKRVKDAILDAREHALYWLGRTFKNPSPKNKRKFAIATMHYYNTIKTKLQQLKGNHPKLEILDNLTEIPVNPNFKTWQKIFNKVDMLCEDMGVMKIELPKDEELDEEHALIQGHSVFKDL